MKNTSNNVDDGFDFGVDEGFVGSNVGGEPEQKWNYKTIGYQAQSGTIYFDKDEVESFTGTILAIRQCKEVIQVVGRKTQTFRYPIFAKRETMETGDEERTRLQALIWSDGALYVFGGSAWTMRGAFVNPKPEGRQKEYSDEKLPVGVWIRLADYIASVKKEKGIVTSPLCYKLVFSSSEDTIKQGEGSRSSKVHPLIIKPAGTNTPEEIAILESLYETEDVKGWMKQWGSATSEEAENAEEEDNTPQSPEDDGDDIPF